MTANFQAFLPYAHNGCHGQIIGDQWFFGECWPIDSVSKIMKLHDHVAKNIKFIAYNLIVYRMHSFYSVAEMAHYWQSVSTL